MPNAIKSSHTNSRTADSGHILVTFPENYRLYEHIKKTEINGKLEGIYQHVRDSPKS